MCVYVCVCKFLFASVCYGGGGRVCVCVCVCVCEAAIRHLVIRLTPDRWTQTKAYTYTQTKTSECKQTNKPFATNHTCSAISKKIRSGEFFMPEAITNKIIACWDNSLEACGAFRWEGVFFVANGLLVVGTFLILSLFGGL